MPSFIVKPDRDEDFYVQWSTVVDAPTAFGSREWLLAHAVDARPDRLDRADLYGTSAKPGSEVEGWFGWDDDTFIYEQQGILRRRHLKALCARLAENERADVSDLLEPFDDDAADA